MVNVDALNDTVNVDAALNDTSNDKPKSFGGLVNINALNDARLL